MNFIEALFKDIDVTSAKTNKIRRKAWPEWTWIEAGEHGQMNHIWPDLIHSDKFESHTYPFTIEMLEDDWIIVGE
jgi:hypothetical protein